MPLYIKIWLWNSLAVMLIVGAAALTGWLTHAQMLKQGVSGGWSLMEHGGTWGDLLLMGTALALIISRYRLAYSSPWGICLLFVAIIVAAVSMRSWVAGAVAVPEAHAHGGETSLVGWLHCPYMIFSLWVLLLFFLAPTVPTITRGDLLTVTGLITGLLVVGVVKFSLSWKLEAGAIWQVGIGVTTLWVIAAVRLYFF